MKQNGGVDDKMKKTFCGLTAGLILAGCERQDMNIYKSNQIDALNVRQSDNGVEIAVRPMLETAYYLAGAVVTRNGETARLRLVRCGLKKDCAVDAPAVPVAGDATMQKIMIAGASMVEIAFADGEIRGY